MAFKLDDLSTIDSSKGSWNIVVKVIRLWISPSFGGGKLPFSMEMVLMDAKGSKFHVSVKKTLVYKFQPLLTEGRVYNISYFGVGENSGDFKTTSHPFKLNFHMHTSVRLETKTVITKSPYSFTPLSDIMFKDPDSSFLVDVIGILTGSTAEQEFEKNGKIEKRVTIELDQEGVRMECCFFRKYVPQIMGQLASGDMTNMVVLVNFAKIKPFRGSPSIQNVYGATQILFNPDIEEFAPLRERFFAMNDPSLQVLSQLQDSAKLVPSGIRLANVTGRFILLMICKTMKFSTAELLNAFVLNSSKASPSARAGEKRQSSPADKGALKKNKASEANPSVISPVFGEEGIIPAPCTSSDASKSPAADHQGEANASATAHTSPSGNCPNSPTNVLLTPPSPKNVNEEEELSPDRPKGPSSDSNSDPFSFLLSHPYLEKLREIPSQNP
ncbi:replication protein A 70 kDa DNA-binding subunit B-like [Lotus japonicus]|uniref:replication protein A 70 kDa DNA-binding subunit B-like n=1 Tax=Lotus japonicus TaxID=34305 RepID=UPI00258DA41D|nr:replication protein A 70 kDa DNA-binding subunit B-like [Lotus japonicus]